MLENEEDIKNKLLMPYLTDLGFDLSEITLERSFTIRLGRSPHTIESTAGGRLDIACKRNGKYLFVLELKRDELALTDDDRDQGISYARLLENIAPFVIVSNGSSTAIYDTITRQKIDGDRISNASAFWKNGCTLSTPDDFEIRHAALMHFVGRSPENLGIFSRKQVTSRMGNITGDSNDLYAKYIRELYIDREAIEEEFGNFQDSSYPVFAVIGESGVGKTNVVCHLCESKVGSQLVLQRLNGH
jgi:type I site-specific restriction endonuclease